jgi:hypothetical protein
MYSYFIYSLEQIYTLVFLHSSLSWKCNEIFVIMTCLENKIVCISIWIIDTFKSFSNFKNLKFSINLIGLYHPLDTVTNPKYKLLHFLTTKNNFCKVKKALAFNWDRRCHLALCLWLILFH